MSSDSFKSELRNPQKNKREPHPRCSLLASGRALSLLGLISPNLWAGHKDLTSVPIQEAILLLGAYTHSYARQSPLERHHHRARVQL